MNSKVGCCSSCIDDRGISQQIFPTMNAKTGTCKYCKKVNVTVVTPIDLRDGFELLQSSYVQNDNGELLANWLKKDWLMFPDMNNADITLLLADILNDDSIVRKKFIPKLSDNNKGLLDWDSLRTELMSVNRFFPEKEIPLDRLKELLSLISIQSEEISQKWFRSRIQNDDTPFSIEQMGPPPNKLATHGRANPVGIPYLYIASDELTAISEIRPHTGEDICVAEFTLKKKLNLVDLRNPRKLVSPFLLDDEDEVSLLRRDIKFLEALGNELVHPVLPKSAAIDYIPSQYLCEYIKKCRFAGVIYKSSVENGINLALFSPENAIAGKQVTQHKVTKVLVETSE